MSAIDTAQRVIEWAIAPHDLARTPPQGDLGAVEQLANPPQGLQTALATLSTVTAARLAFAAPDPSQPLGIGAIVIAAAIGAGAAPQIARLLLAAVPPSSGSADWFARHGVIAPALPYLAPDLTDDCRIHGPFTALLDRPAEGQQGDIWIVLRQLMAQPAQRRALTIHLAQPIAQTDIRSWRTEILTRLRAGTEVERRFVVDVYETMMMHHEAEALEQIRHAYVILTNPAMQEDEQLADAVAVARWWGPLFALERAERSLLRQRYYLGTAYREGIKLFSLSQRMTGGTL